MTIHEAPSAGADPRPEGSASTGAPEATVPDGTPDAHPVSVGARRGHSHDNGRGTGSDLHTEARKAVGMVLALTAALSAILAMFVGIAVNSGPNGVRLAVAGPPPAIEQITSGLAQVAGPDAFEVTVVGDEAAARAALEQREADGAIVVGPAGPVLLTASAGSPAITQMLTTAAASLGGQPASGAPVVDVVALPSSDPHGAGFASGSFPMIIAGLVLGAAAALRLRNRWIVLGAVVGGALVIAASFAGVLAWLGVTSGSYWDVASAISLTVATSALVVAGLVRLMGIAGAALGALLLVIVGNPLSGIATSPYLLPSPWGEFGQWLPTGAGGTLLRSIVYFPEASVWGPLLVLLSWAVIGAGMVIIGRKAPVVHGARPAQPVPAS